MASEVQLSREEERQGEEGEVRDAALQVPMPIKPGVGVSTRFKSGPEHILWKGKKRLSTAGWKLGVTEEDYERMLKNQEGACVICFRPPKKQRLCVDHDHKTGKIRGLACYRCNYGMSWFQDDPARFLKAAEYLHRAS